MQKFERVSAMVWLAWQGCRRWHRVGMPRSDEAV